MRGAVETKTGGTKTGEMRIGAEPVLAIAAETRTEAELQPVIAAETLVATVAGPPAIGVETLATAAERWRGIAEAQATTELRVGQCR